MKKIFLVFSVAGFGWLAALETTAQADQASGNPICLDRLDRVASSFEEMAESANRPDDMQEKLFDLVFDPEEIVRFVKDQVRFEPYSGTLKGPRGTLSARAGNALDQSLLLAKLLKDAGFDARIVRGQLNQNSAQLLAQAALADPQQPEIFADSELYASRFKALGELTSQDELPSKDGEQEPGKPSPQVLQAAERLNDLTNGQLAQNDYLAVLEDYFWVQWRAGPGDEWIAAHPGYGPEEPPSEIEVNEFFADRIPQELQHRVRFEMGIERLEDGRLVSALIASPWERPASNFFDAVITTGIVPMNMLGAGDSTSLFLPLFNGQAAPGGQAFNLLGQVVDLESASSAAAGVFQEVGSNFLSAAESISERPKDQPMMALTGQFVRVTWIRPDGRSRSEERWLLDRLVNRGNDTDPPRIDLELDESAIAGKLSYLRSYLVQPPGEHIAWSLRRSFEASASKLRWSRAVLEMQDWQEAALEINPSRLPDLSLHEPILLSLASAVHHPLKTLPHQATWRDGPFIAALHIPLQPEPESPAWLDIQFNPWRGANISGSEITGWPAGVIIRGVMDTAWESVVAGGPESYLDTAPKEIELIETPQLPAQKRDQAEGFLLASMPQGHDQQPRWWRINPETGEILGMRSIGGAVTTEYVVGLITLSVGALLLIRSVANCGDINDSTKRNCCYAVAAAFGISGAAGIGAAALATPLGMSAGAALFMGATQLKAMVVIDTAQSIATEAACG